jgi:outer membrane protein TolC
VRRDQAIQLNVLMDVLPNAPVALPRTVSIHMPDVADELILYERAEVSRPLLKEMESHVKAAESRRDLAEKASYPDFKLGVAYGFRSGDNPPPVGGSRSDFLSVMLSVNLPIYSGSKQSKAVNQRAQELRKNRYALRDRQGAVRSDISIATSDYRRAREQFSLFEAGIIPQAQQTVSSMLAGYQVNQVDFLNLVGSQVTLLNYQVQYWKALTEANQALARLVAAVGAETIYE